jgi:hypothetical protein
MNDSTVELRCLNCGANMVTGQRFCGDCGQRVISGRLRMHDIGHDLLHAITHADHSIFRLVRELALHPGRVAREYIEGRRKKYFGPFAFLIIAVGVTSFLVLLSGVQWFSPMGQSPTTEFLQRHLNLVILVQAPILAAFCALLFWRSRLHYAEHLVLVAFASGFRVTFLALVGTPLMYFSGSSAAQLGLILGYYSLWLVYFAFAAAQFYAGNVWWTACKSLAATLLTQAATFYIVYAVGWIHERVTS